MISPTRGGASVAASMTHFRDADIDFSSDDDDTPAPTSFTVYISFYFACNLVQHEHLPHAYDSCSDLESDDEDKAALFDGFVAPTINTNTIKYESY